MNLLNIKGVRKLLGLIVTLVAISFFTENVESLVAMFTYVVFVGGNIAVNGKYSVTQKK